VAGPLLSSSPVKQSSRVPGIAVWKVSRHMAHGSHCTLTYMVESAIARGKTGILEGSCHASYRK